MNRLFVATLRSTRSLATRSLSTATPVAPAQLQPVKRIGALRGGLVGFLAGVSVTSVGVYLYVVEEYQNSSNEVLKDVLSLSKSIRVLEEHVRALENQQK